ncbi:MAG TPA: hypothetical protein VIK61_08175 [Acidimicrobiia bacterium]
MGQAQVSRLASALVRVGLPRSCVVDTLCRELRLASEAAEAAWADAIALRLAATSYQEQSGQ